MITEDRRLEERDLDREPLARAQACFDALLSPETEHLKVLLKPSG